jgi:hypothetical protein
VVESPSASGRARRGRVDLDHGEVGRRVAADDVRAYVEPFENVTVTDCAVDDVLVGDDVALLVETKPEPWACCAWPVPPKGDAWPAM